jgi:acyl-[acyl-carrier-protein]-phospholipid O-acyltransferase/long-chain-fatty-acid--[acyl-carrier-protein] ligase
MDNILLICIAAGLLTLAVVAVLIYFFAAAPFLVFFFRTLCRVIYRPKFIGRENIPVKGGAMLVCNHVSYLDGFMLYFACPRNVRFVAFAATVPKSFRCVAKYTGLILITPGSAKSVIAAIKAARQALQNGDIVAVFAEGGITRNGQMRGFEQGFMSMLKGVTTPDGKPIPVIPCHIGGLHESMFGSKYSDTKMKFMPRKLLTDVMVAFGKPMTDVKSPLQVQLAVQELGVDTHREHNKKRMMIPVRRLIRTCKKRGRNLMFADSTGIEINGYKF